VNFRVDAGQRKRLLGGDFRPLDFDIKPFGCEPGSSYVLRRTQPVRLVCEDGVVLTIPSEPSHWITVTSVRRHRKGFWRVRFDVHDRRDPVRFLARGNGYTSSRWLAIDELEAPRPLVGDVWQVRREAVVEGRRRERDRARRGRAA
jgi:hypothetical protein